MSSQGASGQGLPSKRVARYRKVRSRPVLTAKADINVTPLVDVVLVLLIIFMVVTPLLARGIAVDLPVTKHHDKKNDDGKDVIVSISPAGAIYFDKDPVPLEKVTALTEDSRRRFPDKGFFIKADHRIKYGRAREVMEAIHKANVENIQLGTDDAKNK